MFDVVVFSLIGRMFAGGFNKACHLEVVIKRGMLLCICAHSARRLASVLGVSALHVLGASNVSSVVLLILDAVHKVLLSWPRALIVSLVMVMLVNVTALPEHSPGIRSQQSHHSGVLSERCRRQQQQPQSSAATWRQCSAHGGCPNCRHARWVRRWSSDTQDCEGYLGSEHRQVACIYR